MPEDTISRMYKKNRYFCKQCLKWIWGIEHACPVDNQKEVKNYEND